MQRKNISILKILLTFFMTLIILISVIPADSKAATVNLSIKKKKIYVSKTFTLSLKNAKGEITWKSSKPSVAIVKDGVVTALKAGKTTISAKYNKKTYKCKVTVKKLKAKYDSDYNTDIKLAPGLYDKDNKLVRSWSDMLYNGDIEYDDNVLKSFCDVREGVKLRIDDSVIRIASGAFSESELQSIIIPESVSSIGSSAFEWCEYLTKITLPASVSSIEQYSFSNCSSLKSISIPSSVKTLGQAAFSNCKSLTSISLPKGVKIIGDWAFMNCQKLKKVTLSSKTAEIGMGAFKNCSVLSDITIPSSVDSIGMAAFDGCPKLSESIVKQIRKINPSALSL